MKKNIILLIIIGTMLMINTFVFGSEIKEIRTTSVEEKAEVNKMSDTEIEANGSYEGDTEYKDYTNIYIMVGVGILIIGATGFIIKSKK